MAWISEVLQGLDQPGLGKDLKFEFPFPLLPHSRHLAQPENYHEATVMSLVQVAFETIKGVREKETWIICVHHGHMSDE
jgi:hypothetical protein